MQLDLDFVARLIKIKLVSQNRSQKDLAKSVEINHITLNRFLNRKINLLPDQIEKIFDELNLWELVERAHYAPHTNQFPSCTINFATKTEAIEA